MAIPERPQQTGNDSRHPRARTASDALLTAALVVLFGGIIAVIVRPVFVRAWALAGQDACLNQMRAISRAAAAYVQHSDGRLPDHRHWPQQLAVYGLSRRSLKCPADKSGSAISYGMNPRYSGARIGDHSDQHDRVVFYEADEHGRPAPRHDGRTMCAYMDGHVRTVAGAPGSIAPTGG